MPDDSSELPARRAESKQRAHQELDRNGRVARLHLGYARLARPDAARELVLRHAALLTKRSKALGEIETHLDDRVFFARKLEELTSVGNAPTVPFESFALARFHCSPPSRS